MGNLLGSPVVDKETHVGKTECGLDYGISSMQGWRIHMEDAHICQPFLYAEEEEEEEKRADGGGGDARMNGNSGSVNAGASSNPGPAPPNPGGAAAPPPPSSSKKRYNRIDVPGHSLFAVFDGHGGTFAAEYSGLNLCRILSRQPLFVKYARYVQTRPEREVPIKDDPQRLAQLNREGLDLLEESLREAFVELDREIMREVQDLGNEDSNTLYGDNDDAIADALTSGATGGAADADASSNGGTAGSGGGEHDPPVQAQRHRPQPSDEEDSGTTVVAVIVTPQWIVCANAGDSRAVYSKGGNRAVPLSYDHKPDDEEEERRIRDAGGYVSGGRVEGDLAVSRGLGDFRFKDVDTVLAGNARENDLNKNKGKKKGNPGNSEEEENGASAAASRMLKPEDQKVSPVPDVIVQNRNTEDDEFIVVACDGIWDVQTNHECIQMVAEMFEEGESNLGLASEEMLDICLRRGSKDNMTALIVKFPAQKIGEGGGVTARRELREAAIAEGEREKERMKSQQEERDGFFGSQGYS